MKLIEALKSLKDLETKAADLRTKISQHCAYLTIETPTYANQPSQVRSWLQAHEDLTREIARLHVAITRTNLNTVVTIQLGNCTVGKTITEWIVRRRILAEKDRLAWECLGDRGLKEQNFKSSPDSAVTQVRIVRCFDPVERDEKVVLYKSEPGLIDRALEVANAMTDLKE